MRDEVEREVRRVAECWEGAHLLDWVAGPRAEHEKAEDAHRAARWAPRKESSNAR